MRRSHAVLCFILSCFFLGTTFGLAQQSPEPPANKSSTNAIFGKVNVTPREDGLTIEISLTAAIIPTSDRLANPDRLVFDFSGCDLQGGQRHVTINDGPVRGLRLSQFSIHPAVTRVVVDSKEPLNFEVKPAGNKVRIEITFQKATSLPAAAKQPGTPQKEHASSDDRIANNPTPRISASAQSRPTAYSLQVKSRNLQLEDLQSLEDKAQAGDVGAQTILALAYHAGVLLKRDDAEALRLLHKAADQGFMAAQECLGIFSERGIGMDQPAPAEALAWYKKAVGQGSADAATNIALMYADGRGIPKNPTEAVTWFRKAAERGDAAAQYNLALIYDRGEGVPEDRKESLQWLTAAAEHNVVPALLDLARLCLHPRDSTAPDVERAIHYYEKAAEQGSALAAAILGNIYAKGGQGKPDYEQSVKWYRKAAEQGQRDGQFGLGVRYAMGQGVAVDLVEARRLFTAAADQGQGEAQYDLAAMCAEGKGGPADTALAVHYFQMAADQGMPKAQFRLGRMLASSAASRGDRVAAYKWLTLSQESVKESAAPLGELRKSMTEQEITEADHEVDGWRSSHQEVRR